MRKTGIKSNESGIALLMAIFTLLLLAALALALLCASDLETTIAANYRDKQTSIYGSLSGLQEARDRLIPSRCDPEISGAFCNDPIAIDTRTLGAPSLSAANVIYIINPDPKDPVVPAPWDPTNKYFDNQLCHDMGPTGHSLLNLTNAPGVCPPSYGSSVPTGNGWYVKPQGLNAGYNDSNSAAGEYQAASSTFPKPLSYKWVRITVKTNNMTSALVMGPGTQNDATVMCWNGKYQIPATSTNGLNSDCTPTKGITLFNGTNTCTTCGFNPPIGSGYVNPIVTISGGGGSGATATAHVTTNVSGAVTGITVVNPGSGYTSAPLVTITGVGTGATATATIQAAGAPITGFSSVTQQNPVGCYASASPAIAITGGGGTGASATAVMTGKTCIAEWRVGVSGTCSAYGGQTVSVGANGGGGSGFAGKVTFKNNGKSITSSSITNPGSNYTTTPTSVSGLSGCTLTSTWTLGYQVQSVALTSPTTGGSGYTSEPNVTIAAPTAPAGSNPPTVSANLGASATNAGQITGVTVTSGGSGYTTVPTVSFSSTSGTGASAVASLGVTGKIDQITLTSAGSGYNTAPTVTITDSGGGTGASISARVASKQTLGRVYVLTSLASTPSGSRTMSQMEVATPVRLPFTLPGALTIDAFTPNVNPGTSNNYVVNGTDANSCGETAVPAKASVGVIDNPSSPTNPSAETCLISTLGGAYNSACPPHGGVKSSNYIGANASPDVEDVYGSLGDLTTPAGADALATSLLDWKNGGIPQSQQFTGSQTGSSIVAAGGTLGNINTNQCPGLYVNGDFSIGPVTGCGILLVTGNLTMQGNYAWYGPVFVIGYGGSFTGGGGGNGIIQGSLFVAQTRDASQPIDPKTGLYPLRATLGTPTVSFQVLGGGGNGIAYDHCWVDNLLGSLNLLMPPSNQPLKTLSVRTIY